MSGTEITGNFLILVGINQSHGQLSNVYWVAVKELNSSYFFGENLLFTKYTHYAHLI